MLSWFKRLTGRWLRVSRSASTPAPIQVIVRRLTVPAETPVATPDDYDCAPTLIFDPERSARRQAAYRASKIAEDDARPYAKLTAWEWVDTETGDVDVDVFVDGDLFEDWLAKRANGEPSRPLPADAAQIMAVLLSKARSGPWYCTTKPISPDIIDAYNSAETPEDRFEALLRLAAKERNVDVEDDDPDPPWWGWRW